MDFSVLSIEAEMDASISFILLISISVIVIACTHTINTRMMTSCCLRGLGAVNGPCTRRGSGIGGTHLGAAIQRGGNFESVRIDAELRKLRTVPEARQPVAITCAGVTNAERPQALIHHGAQVA